MARWITSADGRTTTASQPFPITAPDYWVAAPVPCRTDGEACPCPACSSWYPQITEQADYNDVTDYDFDEGNDFLTSTPEYKHEACPAPITPPATVEPRSRSTDPTATILMMPADERAEGYWANHLNRFEDE